MNKLSSVVHITILMSMCLYFYPSTIIFCYIMCIINIVVGRCDNICRIENRVGWVGIEL
jgi:hypothetical protein